VFALLFATSLDEAEVLSLILQQAGFEVRTSYEIDRAMEFWPERPPELILMTVEKNIEKRKTDIRQIRAHTASPIVVVLDLMIESDAIELVEAGADLVVPRPYRVRLFAAHLKALMRRSSGVPYFSLPSMAIAGLKLDPSARTVEVADKGESRLTQLEFRLLYTLMTHTGQILPTERIVEHVWGYAGEGNRELVRGLVQRLRTKIEPDPRNPKYIKTETGIGYYFIRMVSD
jgi:DNA-binding response OmpR family regulator